MNLDRLLTDLQQIKKDAITVKTAIDMRKKTSMALGGKASLGITIHEEAAFLPLFTILKERQIPFFLLGKGSNLLCSDTYFNGVMIQLGNAFKTCSLQDPNQIICGAAVADSKVEQFAATNHLGDLAFLATIPGSLGGAVFMNAGAYGYEIKDSLLWVDTWNVQTLQIERFTTDQLDFKYRSSYFHQHKEQIILRACFQLQKDNQLALQTKSKQWLQKRKETQPINKKTCGSLFRNPPNNFAAKLIEECGLKGHIQGGARVSPIHSNFIENFNSASFQDVIDLITLIQTTVLAKKGITLQLEGEVLHLDKIQLIK